MSENLGDKDLESLGYEHVQKILNHQRIKQDTQRFRNDQPRLLRAAIVCAFAVILGIYALLPASKIAAVQVTGNSVLPSSYIEELGGLSTKKLFYTSIPSLISYKVRQNPIVSDCKVSLLSGNVVKVAVTEKKVLGYRYTDSAQVVLEDGSSAPLLSQYLDLIANVPLIIGFDADEDTQKLAKAMADVKPEIISQMAEIDKYSLSYDASTVRVLMRTGGYFYASYDSFYKVNYYFDVYANMSDRSLCVVGTDWGSIVNTQVCPWNQTSDDYWTDSNGNVITNSSGDKAIKHYYTDENGNDALDANGNKIPIPINENGDEVVDGDFLAHYADGEYSTGTYVSSDGN